MRRLNQRSLSARSFGDARRQKCYDDPERAQAGRKRCSRTSNMPKGSTRMSAPRKVILTPLIRRVFGRAPPLSPWDSPKPVREELFSLARLEEHARSLALAQRVALKPIKGYPLAGRLADNAAALLDAYRVNAKAIDEGRTITPAAEWLVDNYHLVEKQIREIRSDLPPGYYRQLPKLLEGPFAGYP